MISNEYSFILYQNVQIPPTAGASVAGSSAGASDDASTAGSTSSDSSPSSTGTDDTGSK